MSNKIKFWLDGCDISFIAEAPEDITLKQLLAPCDKIECDYCACGIKSIPQELWDKPAYRTEIDIDYDSICKVDKLAACTIKV